MYPDLTFGPLLAPSGGNLGPIVISPAIPHAGPGFSIQWADLNFSFFPAGGYSDYVWITDDNNNNVAVWGQEVSVAGLAAGQSLPHVVQIQPNVLKPGKYTFHVCINAWWLQSPSIQESNMYNNYTFYGGVEVRP